MKNTVALSIAAIVAAVLAAEDPAAVGLDIMRYLDARGILPPDIPEGLLDAPAPVEPQETPQEPQGTPQEPPAPVEPEESFTGSHPVEPMFTG